MLGFMAPIQLMIKSGLRLEIMSEISFIEEIRKSGLSFPLLAVNDSKLGDCSKTFRIDDPSIPLEPKIKTFVISNLPSNVNSTIS
jgi:hypothetical protein